MKARTSVTAASSESKSTRTIALGIVAAVYLAPHWAQAGPLASCEDRLAALTDDSAQTRATAVRTLAEDRCAESATLLIAALDDSSSEVRFTSARTMGKLGPPATDASIQALVKGMKDDDKLVRTWSAWALSKVEPDAESTVPALIDALTDPFEAVRRSSVLALGNLGPRASDAAAPLLKATDDSAIRVRRYAAWALGQVGAAAEPALERLYDLAKEDDPELSRFSANAAAFIRADLRRIERERAEAERQLAE